MKIFNFFNYFIEFIIICCILFLSFILLFHKSFKINTSFEKVSFEKKYEKPNFILIEKNNIISKR